MLIKAQEEHEDVLELEQVEINVPTYLLHKGLAVSCIWRFGENLKQQNIQDIPALPSTDFSCLALGQT